MAGVGAPGWFAFVFVASFASGCASQPADPPSPQAEATSVLTAFAGSAVDYEPYDTPAEMAEASELVVEGRLERFQEGRELAVTGTGQASGGTVVLVIDEVDILKGEREPSGPDVTYIELPSSEGRTAEDYNMLIPAGTPVLAYLDPAWDGSDPLDESLEDPSAGRPDGAPLFILNNPQSLVLQASDHLVWPMLGAEERGGLQDAHPDGEKIAY